MQAPSPSSELRILTFNLRTGTCERGTPDAWRERRGDCIALSGKSGRVTGPHLHYEVMYRNEFVNPAGYMDLSISPEDYDAMVRKPSGR